MALRMGSLVLGLMALNLLIAIVPAKTIPRLRRSLDLDCKCNDPNPSCQDVEVRHRDCSMVTGYEAECDHLSDLFNNPFHPAKCSELQALKWCISGGILGNERQAIALTFCRQTCACHWRLTSIDGAELCSWIFQSLNSFLNCCFYLTWKSDLLRYWIDVWSNLATVQANFAFF